MSEYTYREQYDLIKSIRLKDGETRRMDCIFCRGRNTLGITKHNGNLEWHCFRASCNAHGIYSYEQTPESLKERLARLENKTISGVPIPDFLVPIDHRPAIIEYLISVNALKAYEAGLVSIKYSPTEDRVLFMQHDEQGAVGRSLHIKPKWKKYGDTTKGFSCGSGKIAVVVEDAPSACAVGVIPEFTGYSLLGTSLTTVHRALLLRYEAVVICLDADAARKGLFFSRSLPNATSRILERDLKYCSTEEIRKIINHEA